MNESLPAETLEPVEGLREKVFAIAASIFDVPVVQIEESSGPQDIGAWDSLGQILLIAEIEEVFGLRFTTEEVFEIVTIGDILRILGKRGISD